MNDELKGYTVKIYNLTGQELYSTIAIPSVGKLIFDYKDLSSGIYVAWIQSGNDIKSYKFSK